MSTLVQYDTPKLPTVGSAQAKANIVVIDDQTTYEMASEIVNKIKGRRKEIDEMRKFIVDPLNKAKDAVQAIFVPVLADYDAAEKIVKTKMVTYITEQDAIRVREQAEADRVAREAALKAEKEAAKLEKKGHVEAAEAVREMAAVASAPVIAPTVTQVGGNSIRHKLVGEVVDKEAFVQFIALNSIYLNVLDVNQGALNKWLAATDGKLEIPGMKIRKDAIMAVRS